MITIPKTGTLATAVISGVSHEGLTVTTADGRPANLAVIDENGTVIASGPEVAKEAWNITLMVHNNFLLGKGYLRVFSKPPGEVKAGGSSDGNAARVA